MPSLRVRHAAFRQFLAASQTPAFVSAKPPVGPLGRLAGRVDVLWAGAVLHVLCKADVEAFAAHAHAMLTPGGVWIGVGCSVCPSCACCPCMHVGHAHLLGVHGLQKDTAE